MSVIVVHRPRELWINHFGKFTILVNGKIVGKVKRGETKTFSGVSSGSVSVRAVIDWLGSRTIILNLSDHDVAHLEVTNGSLLALLDEREHYLDLRLTPESSRFEKPDLAVTASPESAPDDGRRHLRRGAKILAATVAATAVSYRLYPDTPFVWGAWLTVGTGNLMIGLYRRSQVKAGGRAAPE